MTSNSALNTNPSHAQGDRDATGWSASQYRATASFVYSTAFTTPVLELLKAQPGERIIDFGCGSGELTQQIQTLVGEEGVVVAVDQSESMAQKACDNGVRAAFVGDIQDLQLPPQQLATVAQPEATAFDLTSLSPGSFDAIFTNAVLHWCKPRDDSNLQQKGIQGAIASAARALRPGGRFVGEMGGYMNCAGLRVALHAVLRARGIDPVPLDPWYFPDPEEFEKLLKDASLKPVHTSLHPRLTPLPASSGGLLGWLRLFARPHFLRSFDDAEAEAILRDVVDLSRIDFKRGRGEDDEADWALMYVRLRFVAIKE